MGVFSLTTVFKGHEINPPPPFFETIIACCNRHTYNLTRNLLMKKLKY